MNSVRKRIAFEDSLPCLAIVLFYLYTAAVPELLMVQLLTVAPQSLPHYSGPDPTGLPHPAGIVSDSAAKCNF